MQTPASRRELLRGLAGWLIIVPVVLLILFGCGQLALVGGASPTRTDTRSRLVAEYNAWEYVVIPAVNPDIIDEILRDDAREVTGTPAVSTQEPVGTAIAFWPTATPTPRSVNPPPSPTATIADTPPPPPTDTAVPAPSDTPVPPTPTPPDTATFTPTSTPTRRPPPPPTFTPSVTATFPPTATATNPPPPPATDTPVPPPTATFSPSLTPSDTPLPTFTPTPSDTPTPTDTPIPCPDGGQGGEPNLGAPDGVFREVGCGTGIIIDLGAGSPVDASHAGYDLVYYEREDGVFPGNIAVDWVMVDVCADPACFTAYTVFNWGDNFLDANTSIGAAGYGSAGEPDNQPIPMASPPLFGAPPLAPWGSGPFITGVGIDVTGIAPPGLYQWVKVYSPLGGGNDASEVDALYVIP